jgi:hypothetical protein
MKYLILLILLSGCVTHRPRYNHYAEGYKMSTNNHHIKKKYAPVKQFKPNVK